MKKVLRHNSATKLLRSDLIKIHLGCTHVKETILIRQVSDEVFTKSLLSEHPTINDDEFDILLTGFG